MTAGLALLTVLAAWIPVVVHPVKDQATHDALRRAATEVDPAVQERARDALAIIARGTTDVVGAEQPVALPDLPAAQTAEALRQLTPEEAAAQPARVLDGLQSPHAVVQEESARAAGRGRVVTAVPDLLKLLEDDDEGLRQAACAALRALGPRGDRAAVITALGARLSRERSALVCAAACGVLLAIHDKPAQRELVRVLQDPNELVRAAAVRALVEWGDHEVAPAIQPLILDPVEVVATTAVDALAALKHPASGPMLLERFDQLAPAAQIHAAYALGDLGVTAAAPKMLALVGTAADELSAGGAYAVGRLNYQEAIPVLRRPIENVTVRERSTRTQCVQALHRLGDRGCVNAVFRIVTEKVVPVWMGPAYDSAATRNAGLRLLADFGDRQTAERLVGVLSTPEGASMFPVLEEALRLLVRHGDRVLGERLLTCWHYTPPAEARSALCDTIRALTGKEYRPLPNQDHLSYFIETLGPPPYQPVPSPPGIVPAATR